MTRAQHHVASCGVFHGNPAISPHHRRMTQSSTTTTTIILVKRKKLRTLFPTSTSFNHFLTQCRRMAFRVWTRILQDLLWIQLHRHNYIHTRGKDHALTATDGFPYFFPFFFFLFFLQNTPHLSSIEFNLAFPRLPLLTRLLRGEEVREWEGG